MLELEREEEATDQRIFEISHEIDISIATLIRSGETAGLVESEVQKKARALSATIEVAIKRLERQTEFCDNLVSTHVKNENNAVKISW
jgi:hypothetical protein